MRKSGFQKNYYCLQCGCPYGVNLLGKVLLKRKKFIPILFIEDILLVYYLALFGECCVAICYFCRGYLYDKYSHSKK